MRLVGLVIIISVIALWLLFSGAITVHPTAENNTPGSFPVTDDIQKDAEVSVKADDAIMFNIAGRNLALRPKDKILPGLKATQQKFLEKYIAAVNGNKLEDFRALVHPQSLKCLDAADKEFSSYRFGEYLRYNIADSYHIYFAPYVQKFEPSFQAAMDQWYKDPVAHSHTLMISYKTANGGSETISHRLLESKDGEELLLVLGCPTKATVEQYLKAQREKQVVENKAKALYDALSDSDKRELAEILQEKGFDAAVTAYEEKISDEAQKRLSHIVMKFLYQDMQKQNSAGGKKSKSDIDSEGK